MQFTVGWEHMCTARLAARSAAERDDAPMSFCVQREGRCAPLECCGAKYLPPAKPLAEGSPDALEMECSQCAGIAAPTRLCQDCGDRLCTGDVADDGPMGGCYSGHQAGHYLGQLGRAARRVGRR
jgi:hypothetical protein